MTYSKQNFQNGQILNAANLEAMENGIIAGQGARNLLINSDFRNPINTIRNNWPYSGKESHSTDIIDMWRTWSNHCTYNITTNGMTISNSSTTNSQGPIQRILSGDNIKGKTVTLALGYNNGDIICGTVSVPSGTVTEDIYLSAVQTTGTHPGLRIVIYLSTNEPEFQILIYKNKASTIQWAALYEGAYSIETLPSYISNSPLQEFVNCKAILSPRNLLDNSNFSNCINYNGLSNYEGLIYSIDKWYGISMYQTVSILSDSIKATANNTSYVGISQKVRDISKFAGKTVTFAAKVYSNVIPNLRFVDASRNAIVNIDGKAKTTQTLILTYTLPSNATSDNVIPTILCRTTAANDYINIYWAALYDGGYTADTLPNYQPKDRKIEILNCNVPLAPHNLLDNSDFRIKNNIINTKGLTDYSLDSGDVFDRWRLHWTGDGRVSIKDGYIELYRKTYSTYLFQYPKDLESMIGKTYTVAAKVRYNGYIGWIDSTQRVNSGSLALNDWDIATCTFTVGSATSDIGKAGIEIATKADLSFEVQWVALYEGAYTKETLPAYLTKGKHIEMLNCNVPLAPHNLLDNSDFTNPVNQRGQTSYTGTGGKVYTIDRWHTWSASISVSVQSGYLSVTNSTDSIYQNISQIIDKHNLTNKAATIAVWDAAGNVYCASGVISTNNEISCNTPTDFWFSAILEDDNTIYFAIRPRGAKTANIKAAALYEGAYDASTLPPYVPKGYAAELAECQRYYYQTWAGSSANIWDGMCVCEAITAKRLTNINFPQIMRISKPSITIYSPKTGTAGKVSEFVSDTEIENITPLYTSNHGFLPIVSEGFEVGKHYCLHYSVNADL